MSKLESSDREKLSGLLMQMPALFDKMHEYCLEQTKLLEEDNYDELNASLVKAQKLRDKINGLYQESSQLMQSYIMKTDAVIDELILKINKQTEICAGINEKNMNMLQEKKEQQTKKIDDQRAKREGITGYAQAVTVSPEVFDKKQ